jgi:hypothetical protein
MDNLEAIVELGSYSENLLIDPNFQFISAYFEQQAVQEILSTQPQETKKREYLYAKVQAHREFLTQLAEFVKEKNKALEPQIDQEDFDLPVDPN